MSLFSLKDLRNHPRRSAFDVSSKVAFSAKVGELLPVFWSFTMPGDKFKLNHQHFTRTQPVNTSAYTRVREYYDWFFVPFHLLWRNAPEVISQMQRNVQHASSVTKAIELGSEFPHLTCQEVVQSLKQIDGLAGTANKNFFGFNRADLGYKLIQYLRFGNCNDLDVSTRNYGTSVPKTDKSYNQEYAYNLTMNAFPLLAYKKFCQDYFRYSQWQDSAPYLWNVDYLDGSDGSLGLPVMSPADDYWKGNTIFDLEYCNWNKDMFTGIVPDTQYGDVSTIDITLGQTGYTAVLANAIRKSGVNPTPNSPVTVNESQLVSAGVPLNFDVLSLRRGEALQRWKEISLNTPQNYRAQIKAHFGVDVGENMSGMSTYIGGSASSLDISEVVNTNITETNEANIAGKGIGTASSHESFTANDWGVIMCIYHAVPLLDYVLTAPAPQLVLTQNTDFPVPELDSIGMESLPVSLLTNNPSDLSAANIPVTSTLGYLPRYYAWKTNVDYVLGAFTTTEKEWVAPITSALMKNMLNGLSSTSFVNHYNFFKVNPAVLNSIFAADVDSTWDTDQFLINCAFDVRVVRNLDYSGMPY